MALLAITGFAFEAVLLTGTPDHVYLAGGPTPLVAVMFLVWFWVTVGWATWWVARLCSRLAQGSRPVAVLVYSVATLAVSACVLVYMASWGFFLQSGRFANLEVLQFLLVNPRGLWNYVIEAEPVHLVWFGVLSTLLLVGTPLLLRLAGRSAWSPSAERSSAARRHSAWRWVTIATLFVTFFVTCDLSPQRKTMRFDSLKYGLNPTLALSASGFETLLEEPIEACLDVAELEPIAEPMPVRTASSQPKRPSIIILAIEALRHDVIYLEHQGREVLPNLNRLTRDSLQFTRSYTQSTHSDYADVCLVSSLYPLRTRRHHYFRKGDPWPKTLIYDVLKPAGYATAIFSSQNEAWGGMDQFLQSPNLDRFYDPEHSDAATQPVSDRDPGFAREVQLGTLVAGKFPDAHTTDKAIEWIRQQVADGRPFYLSMNFQSSHFPYLLPEGTDQPFQPYDLDADVNFVTYPVEKMPKVRNAYYNAIHECDRQLGRLVAALRELGQLDDTILVVTGENGEAFHEHGSVGHAREPIEPAIHVANVFHAPNLLKPGTEDYPFEHVDLVPTLLGLVGLPSSPNFQGIDVFSADRPLLAERLLFFHVLSPLARVDAVLLAGRWKYVHDYNTRLTALYDLETDPGETIDVSAANPATTDRLRHVLSSWRRRQLAYYHYPMYYQNYYPPQPPKFVQALATVDTTGAE